MATFGYSQEGSQPLNMADLYRLFNNYRLGKYIIGILLNLNKTQLCDYKILEPGCGGGDKLRFFTELRVKPENCYGLDISEKAIDLCKSLSPSTMNFQVGSVFDMPFEKNTFDIIICSGLFDSFNDDSHIIEISKELQRVIKDDGILFAIDINENFNINYGASNAVMQKKLRFFDSKKGELEHLLSDEFSLVLKKYIFGADLYLFDGKYAQIAHLPAIDNQIDRGEGVCAYSLWTFSKKITQNDCSQQFLKC